LKLKFKFHGKLNGKLNGKLKKIFAPVLYTDLAVTILWVAGIPTRD
jgi:hypothetical protein